MRLLKRACCLKPSRIPPSAEHEISASKGIILVPVDLLDIKFTLISARSLNRQLERGEISFPFLSEIALGLPAPMGLVDAISSTV